MSTVNGASPTPQYGDFLTRLREQGASTYTSADYQRDFGENPIRGGMRPNSDGVPSVRQTGAHSSRALEEAVGARLDPTGSPKSSGWGARETTILPSEKVPSAHSLREASDSDAAGPSVNLQAPSSSPAARQTSVSRWSGLSVWQKAGVIALLLIPVIGIPLLTYMCCSKVPAPSTQLNTGAPRSIGNKRGLSNISAKASPSSRVPNLVTEKPMRERLSTQVLNLQRQVSPRIKEVRLKKEAEISSNLESYKSNSEGVHEHCTMLVDLAKDSGKSYSDFREAIRKGDPIDALGLRYFRWKQDFGEIPHKLKGQIEGLYEKAVAFQTTLDEIPGRNKQLQREILSHFSGTEAFDQALSQKLPYQLQVDGQRFSPYSSFSSNLSKIDQGQLCEMLAKWAGHPEYIKLSDSDPAFVAQYYLAQLASKELLVISDDERTGLRKSRMDLETLPRTHTVQLLPTARGAYVIESNRKVEMRQGDGTVKATYDWTEQITLTPQKDGCDIDIQKSVKKIKPE